MARRVILMVTKYICFASNAPRIICGNCNFLIYWFKFYYSVSVPDGALNVSRLLIKAKYSRGFNTPYNFKDVFVLVGDRSS